jgi:parallel beta-helix repeat protein
MEPKSIAFYTAVAVSILAVISATTTFPVLAQSTQAANSEQEEQNTSDDSQSVASSDSQAESKEHTNKPAADKDPRNEENNVAKDEKGGERNSNDPAGNSNDRESRSLGLADSNPLVSCGETITTSVRLTSDLVCDGTALYVGANDIVLDFNGHSIRNSGEASPIDQSMGYAASSGVSVMNADGVTIKGLGSVVDYGIGISVIGSSGTQVTDLQLSGNTIGILASGSNEFEFARNSLTGNEMGIVADTSTDGVIVFNSLVTNERQGILLRASNNNVVAADDLYGNGDYGVSADVQSSGNTFDYITSFGHAKADMNNANGLPLSINNNNFGEHNNCETSTPAGLCPGGNTPEP